MPRNRVQQKVYALLNKAGAPNQPDFFTDAIIESIALKCVVPDHALRPTPAELKWVSKLVVDWLDASKEEQVKKIALKE